MSMMPLRTAARGLVIGLVAAAGAAAQRGSPPGPSRQAATDAATILFLNRVAEYIAIHTRVEQDVPALTETSDPAKITAREVALGVAVMRARPAARQGDIFVAACRPLLTRIIQTDFAKRSLADRKALVVELPKGVKVSVNTVYPTALPLATFPANLLEVLPELPPELEYRILGRDLILRDSKANLIVDVLPNVFPIPSA